MVDVSDSSIAPKRPMWRLWLGVGVICALIGSVVVLRKGGYERFETGTFITSAMGPARPTDLGIDYEAIKFSSGDRQLTAWWVGADQAKAAVLVWHGQNEALSNWTHAIKRLHDSGLSVLVFDYTGFGDSPGTPTVQALRQDSIAAAQLFEVRAGKLPRYLLGYSMGAGVMLDHLRDHPLAAQGVVLVSAWSSIRDVAMESGALPKAFAWMVPDEYNNTQNLSRLNVPVRIVHSRTDGRFPLAMAEANHAMRVNSSLVITASPAHSEFLADPKVMHGKADQFWDGVLGFMR